VDFPEYAIKYSKQAAQTKAALPPELLGIVDEIVNDRLAYDPLTPRAEIIPASRDGKTFIYMHPRPQLQITYEVDAANKVIFLFHFVAPSFSVKKSLFISYSHQDGDWLKQLRPLLSGLEQEGIIEFWDDGKLAKGEQWRPQIEKVLSDCIGGVLLVSPDFLGSPFITDVELPALLSTAIKGSPKKKIFWVHLRRCDENNEKLKVIMEYQSLLDDPRRPLSDYNDADKAKALGKIAGDIRAAVTN
jgi:hypothetical protein